MQWELFGDADRTYISETNFFSETNLKFYPLFYNHNIIIFISLRLKVLNFNISAFLFKVQFYV